MSDVLRDVIYFVKRDCGQVAAVDPKPFSHEGGVCFSCLSESIYLFLTKIIDVEMFNIWFLLFLI